MSSKAWSNIHHFSGDYAAQVDSASASVVRSDYNTLHTHKYVPPANSRSPTPEHFPASPTASSATSVGTATRANQEVPVTGPEAQTSSIHDSIPRRSTIIHAYYDQQPQYAYADPQYHYYHEKTLSEKAGDTMPQQTTVAPSKAASKAASKHSTAPAKSAKAASEPKKEPKHTPKSDRHIYVPAVEAEHSDAHIWHGRTKAQVEADNMRLAKQEGVYDKRKVAPVGVSDDQYFWVVDPSGANCLRTLFAIKELNGVWKRDPRYEDAWFFLCDKK